MITLYGIRIKDGDVYQDWRDRNSDDYSRACFTFAERWAALLEAEVACGECAATAIAENAQRLCRVADTEGITGFMYGAAVSILAHCWVHGEELRQWHNLDTQIGNEGKRANKGSGVLNPALLSFG
jgi:hypothetical protein